MVSKLGKVGKWTLKEMQDQTGKTVIVTGSNSGTGFEAARAFALKGATTILACRSIKKGNEAISRIQKKFPNTQVDFLQLDLADLESVRQFSSNFKNKYDQLDVLINNAGVMTPPYSKTKDGYELQFGINHLGHFAITGLLMEVLLKAKGSRIVTMSSLTHSIGKINFEDLHYEKKYKPFEAYSQSKLANLLFALELQRKLKEADSDVISLAAHPGWTGTNILRKEGILQFFNVLLGMKPEQGALPLLYASVGEEVAGGEYYGPGGFKEMRGYPSRSKIAPGAEDQLVAKKLWDVSEKLSGIKYVFN